MEGTHQIRISILDLGCGDSARIGLERTLAGTHGVLAAIVNPATGTAYLEVDPAETDARTLAEVIAHAGFRPRLPVNG